ncbi:hypothetical protein CHF27_010910 [Romboutsia maritimum]|uniref:Uncharacterized protein n=2 Tax=Romboutsia maritimum TaxID=2020948 RepID=A0A371IR29_9FIRM|nr:hypothetical protein CHF27_010910 [Romboutsia maritimum]
MVVFLIVTILYLLISIAFASKTSIFYDTHNKYDVLLNTDTGVLLNWNTFAIAQDNSKHILFSAIVSLFAYPIFLISQNLAKTGTQFTHIYGFGLIILQILISATSVTLIYSCIKDLCKKRLTRVLIIGIMIVSFPQIFMSVNIERFIYAQLSLVVFIFLVSKLKNQESYLIDIAAIPLFGITLTNIYVYFINLLLEFKINLKKILTHLSLLVAMSYFILVSTKSYNSFFLVKNTINSDSMFIATLPILEKIKMTILRLIYPILYFPGQEILYNTKMVQNGAVNKVFLILGAIVLLLAIIGGIRNFKKKVPKLCLGIILANIVLHGVIGYSLDSANIMVIHFTFAIILLLGYLAQTLSKKQTKLLNVFLGIVFITIVISNIQGFIEIFNLGVQSYPR